MHKHKVYFLNGINSFDRREREQRYAKMTNLAIAMIILPKYELNKHFSNWWCFARDFNNSFHRKSSATKKERKRMQRTVKASDRRGYMNEWPIWHRMYWSSDTYFARYYIGTKSYHACANLLAIILQCFSDVYKTFITYKRHRNAIHLYMRRIFDK